jgi:putative IMPACT (imprinted ancient) family translation regulator
LRALQAAELSDALLVVVRWFGGTKLGKGGLARAYGAAARAAIAAAPTRRRLRRVRVTLRPAYAQVGAVQRLLRPPEVELVEEVYGESARILLAVAEDRLGEVRERAAELGIEIEVGEHRDAEAGV